MRVQHRPDTEMSLGRCVGAQPIGCEVDPISYGLASAERFS